MPERAFEHRPLPGDVDTPEVPHLWHEDTEGDSFCDHCNKVLHCFNRNGIDECPVLLRRELVATFDTLHRTRRRCAELSSELAALVSVWWVGPDLNPRYVETMAWRKLVGAPSYDKMREE